MAVVGKIHFLLLTVIIVCEAHSGLKDIINDVSQASNTFAVNFHRTKTRVSGGKTNTFFSPLSIYVALAMLNVGARGETAYQLQRALNWAKIAHPDDVLNPDEKMRKFITAALSNSESSVKFANKLWVQKGFCISQCKSFAKKLQNNYDSDIGAVDFHNRPEEARNEINSWVSRRTNGKIKDLMEAGTITSLTRLVLTNAIYFKSNWKYKFDESATTDETFTVSREKSVVTKMMRTKAKLMYTQDADFQVVEMQYEASNVSMILILPRDAYGIEKLESEFTDRMLKRYVAKLEKKAVTVWLPRFTIESDIHLKDYLTLMGVLDMFDPDAADLSGMLGFKGFFVTHAIHKAFVEVNEAGTEAAAASGVAIGSRSFDPEAAYFIANHPFMFSIIHRPSVTMLFHGEIVDPTMRVTSTHL